LAEEKKGGGGVKGHKANPSQQAFRGFLVFGRGDRWWAPETDGARFWGKGGLEKIAGWGAINRTRASGLTDQKKGKGLE